MFNTLLRNLNSENTYVEHFYLLQRWLSTILSNPFVACMSHSIALEFFYLLKFNIAYNFSLKCNLVSHLPFLQCRLELASSCYLRGGRNWRAELDSKDSDSSLQEEMGKGEDTQLVPLSLPFIQTSKCWPSR